MKTIKIEQRGEADKFLRFPFSHSRASWLLLSDYLPITNTLWVHMYKNKTAYIFN